MAFINRTAVARAALSPQQPFTKLMQITPALAEEWLTANTHNRPVSLPHVASLARAMETNTFRLTHQGIAFDVNNVLADGQHRLLAIIKSGCTVWMNVTWNVAIEALPVIDSGVNVRTVGQQMGLHGEVAHSGKVASICTAIRNLKEPKRAGDKNTFAESMTYYAAFKDAVDWAISAMGGGRVWGCAPLLGALAFGYQADPVKAAVFAAQVRNGENLKRTDPAYALRNFAQEMPSISAQSTRKLLTQVTLRCMYAAFHGHSLGVVKPNAMVDSETVKTAIKFFARAHRTPRGSA